MEEDNDFRQRVQRVESLIQGIEHFADPAARAHAQELVRAILDYHGTALAKLVGMVERSGPTGRELVQSLARDDLVGSLLLLYGLHPEDLQSRVELAIDKLRPAVQAHGGEVELGSIVGGVIRVRLGVPGGSGSSFAILRRDLEDAICQEAPDATAIEVEEVENRSAQGITKIPLPVLHR